MLFQGHFLLLHAETDCNRGGAAYRSLCTNWVRVEPFKTNKVTAELNYKPHSFIDTSTDDSRSHLHKSSLPQTLSQPKAVALLWIVWLALFLVCLPVCFPRVCMRVCVVRSSLVLCLLLGLYILWSTPLLNNLKISQWLSCIIYKAKGDNAKARLHQRALFPHSLLLHVIVSVFLAFSGADLDMCMCGRVGKTFTGTACSLFVQGHKTAADM